MPAHALEMHINSVVPIDEILAQPFDGPTIVRTHHAPSPRSIARSYQGNALTPAFSDLTDLIVRHQPAAWIYSHMHSSADHWIGRTRVLNNPHGYGNENAGAFELEFVIDTTSTLGS